MIRAMDAELIQDVYLTPLISYVEKGQDHLFSVQRGSRKTRLKQECLMEMVYSSETFTRLQGYFLCSQRNNLIKYTLGNRPRLKIR